MNQPLIAGADIETTGLLSPEHRIIEIYVGLYGSGHGEKIDELELRIHPQRSIAVDAQRVHGISLIDLDGCPLWEDVADQVHRFLNRADLIVGHNWKEFDGPFVDQEFKRVGLAPLNRPIFDTMLEGRFSTAIGKVPNLAEFCFAMGVDYDPAAAHAAAYDVDVMMKSFFRAVEWGYTRMPEVHHVEAA